MTYAELSDVRVYAPDIGDDEQDKVSTLLEQAEAELELEFPDLHERVADGRTQLVHVVRVESEMVASVMRNPRALTSESEGVGGLNDTRGFNLEVASGLLTVTARHRRLIRGSSGGGAFTVNAAPGARPPGPDRVGWRVVGP